LIRVDRLAVNALYPMRTELLTRSRVVLGQKVQEPTLLAFILLVMGFALLLGVCALGIAFLPAFGLNGWLIAVLAVILAGLVLGSRRKLVPAVTPSTGRQSWFSRLRRLARWLLIALLACWLALLIWPVVCPNGPSPSPKTDPALIRVITWNIHCGQDDGLPWQHFDWPRRKPALQAALDQAQPDILCVQEATPTQVRFLEGALPGHRRVGGGRDDGHDAGEHCAIYFSRERFEELGGATFWLEEPIDQPRLGGALDVKRICTWVRLRDRVRGRTLRVYNTHLYLTETPRLTAVGVIRAQIAAGDPADAVLLTADFNASPSAPSRRLFGEAGLVDSAVRAGEPTGKPTFHFLYGIGVQCLDGILVDSHWQVHNHRVLNVKPLNTFPSDHFALLADLRLSE
jgi:endonuclease/exonuclease/phosphatase family metal-dependent hydrolase